MVAYLDEWIFRNNSRDRTAGILNYKKEMIKFIQKILLILSKKKLVTVFEVEGFFIEKRIKELKSKEGEFKNEIDKLKIIENPSNEEKVRSMELGYYLTQLENFQKDMKLREIKIVELQEQISIIKENLFR